MSLIEVIGLSQCYGGRQILKNINLAINKGETFALIGPTGAGKTALLRLIDLLEIPAAGKIIFDGIETTALGRAKLEIRRRMAFVLQKPIVFNMSIYENIACGLRWRGQRGNGVREKVNRILEVVGLSAEKSRNARTLSGGEVQRVVIARAIVIEPEVLLLDEPTANLDPIATSKIEDLISRIIKQYKTTVIMATHDMSQGQRLADRIGVMVNGEILQVGDPRQVFSSPQTRQVAEFVGVENIINGVITANEAGIAIIDVGDNVIQAISDYAVGEAVSACIRPEEITLTLSPAPSSARNSFTGKITRAVSVGPLTRVELDCGFPLVSIVTKKSAEELHLESGRSVCAGFKATGVHVIRRRD